MNTRYELLYIIPTTFTDEEVGGVETKINALLTKLGATIESTKRLGKFRLAYPIKKQRHGHYVMVIFTAERTTLAKIEENLRIATDILRHLTLQADEAGTDQKFELIQFTEIVVEGGRDDRRRREKADAAKKEGEKEEGKEEKPAESVEGKEAPVTTEEKAA